MTAPSLLNINVDNLFEQHSIAEIDQIHKKLQNDVEEKKEELRTMVGERYRDLLKAADTIGDMKTTGATVTGHIDDIIATCRSLNEQQLIGFKTSFATPPPHHSSSNTVTKHHRHHHHQTAVDRGVQNFYGIAVQIKLLTQLPELIWSCIDAENFFVATQLFIFSRHISTGLQLDLNRPIMRSFPVAKQLWSMLSPFFHTIKVACVATLERERLDGSTAAQCLASILILENGSMDKLLALLIQQRGKAFKQALAEGTDAERHERVQSKILKSLRILIDTLDLIYVCFIDGGDGNGLVMNELMTLTAESARPTVSLIETEDTTFVKTLPDIIAKYKPHVQVVALPEEALRTMMGNWLQYTSNDCRRQISAVINVIASVRTIHKIKTEAFVIEKPKNWSSILQRLFLPANLDLYQFCYHPLISERVKEIITTSWQATIAQTQSEVNELMVDAQKSKKDVQSKWNIDSADIPLSLKQALSHDRHSHRLLMKSKGYTDAIINVCQSLDANLKSIFADLNLYLTDGPTTDPPPRSVTVETDHSDVVRFLQETSRNGVSELITTIKSTDFKHSQSTLIALATLLKAITELCPNLKLCLFQNHSTHAWPATVRTPNAALSSAAEQWDTVCRLLDEESLRFWRLWIEMFVDDALGGGRYFGDAIDYVAMTKDLLTWERITVVEKDEHDRAIESAIRVPAHPSVRLQQFSHGLCRNLNEAVPYALRRPVTVLLCEAIAQQLANVYAGRGASEFVRSNQNASLQCYFDVKFVQLLLVARDNKRLVDTVQGLAATFKANVDPFDFELFHKYVMLNVKKSGQRLQHKLGNIMPSVEAVTASLVGTTQPASGIDREPNVLALSTSSGDDGSGWFSMLPVMTTTVAAKNATVVAHGVEQQQQAKGKRSGGQQQQQQQHQQQVQQSTLTPSSSSQNLSVKSGAAAFFGAMSQDWFR